MLGQQAVRLQLVDPGVRAWFPFVTVHPLTCVLLVTTVGVEDSKSEFWQFCECNIELKRMRTKGDSLKLIFILKDLRVVI